MSTIYGIFYRDGSPVGREEAEGMHRTFSWWEPDEARYLLRENLFLGQATLRITPESRHEHLPLERDGYLVAADARIDNREALAPLLDLPRRPLAEIGDSEFILAAYRKWGRECADRLLGDFAFVIWDPRNRELFCARDYIGVRPFYYYLDEKVFIFGSELKSLIRHPRVPTEIREASIADYIVNRQLLDTRHTFFRNVDKLEGGCFLTVGTGREQVRRYWHPGDIPELKLSGEGEYVDRLRELLEDSVRARLRTDHPVASHLSGGLDSSPVAVLVARLQRNEAPLPVYTWHAPPANEEARQHFEWRRLAAVVERERMELIYNEPNLEEMTARIRRVNLLESGNYMSLFEGTVRREAAGRGVRSIFSGWGGDEFVSNHAYAFYSNLLVEGSWRTLYRELKCWSDALPPSKRRLKTRLSFLYRKVIVPLFPEGIYCHLPYTRCSEEDYSMISPALLPWIEEALRRKTYVYTRFSARTIREDGLRNWRTGHVPARLEAWAQEGLEEKVEYRYPLLDRRLVEFAFALPARYARRCNEDRYLYKRAVKGLLPPELLENEYKREPQLWAWMGKNIETINQKLLEEKNGKRGLEFIGKNILNSDNRDNPREVLSFLLLLRGVENQLTPLFKR